VVPYELELALGASGLAELAEEFPSIRLLTTNLKTPKANPLLQASEIRNVGGARVGFLGLVDPELRALLAKSALDDFTFEDPVAAANREVAALRSAGVEAVIALSNLHRRDNGLLAREVAGLDAVVADLHVRWSPEQVRTGVALPGRPHLRPGSPALVARSFANGLGVGRLDLAFDRKPSGGFFPGSLSHELQSVTDRVPGDPALVRRMRELARAAERGPGQVLVPAFSDLVERRPSLSEFDATSLQGRISKRMWEEFLARLVRSQSDAEVCLLYKLPHFPQAVGELHEAQTRAWLWTAANVVLLDLPGSALQAILNEDRNGDLVVSGFDRTAGQVQGRRIRDSVWYRVATTDHLFEGARFRSFEVARSFTVKPDGRIASSSSGKPLAVREYSSPSSHE
jgi:hypothetical protein